MVLADIFEALTAAYRPYKKAKMVSVAVDILHKLVEREYVDRDVFELFYEVVFICIMPTAFARTEI